MPAIEFTNMIMVQDPDTGKVLVQDRIKSWKGISFPGGHVEEGESFVDSAVREIKEETGLDIYDLKSCGVIHWNHKHTQDRYIVFLYKTRNYKGELIASMEEGNNFWIDIEELKKLPSENGFDRYLPMFLEDRYNEAFGPWCQGEPEVIIYK
jgi:8-oxo-dGTP diphosphatase